MIGLRHQPSSRLLFVASSVLAVLLGIFTLLVILFDGALIAAGLGSGALGAAGFSCGIGRS